MSAPCKEIDSSCSLWDHPYLPRELGSCNGSSRSKFISPFSDQISWITLGQSLSLLLHSIVDRTKGRKRTKYTILSSLEELLLNVKKTAAFCSCSKLQQWATAICNERCNSASSSQSFFQFTLPFPIANLLFPEACNWDVAQDTPFFINPLLLETIWDNVACAPLETADKAGFCRLLLPAGLRPRCYQWRFQAAEQSSYVMRHNSDTAACKEPKAGFVARCQLTEQDTEMLRAKTLSLIKKGVDGLDNLYQPIWVVTKTSTTRGPTLYCFVCHGTPMICR